MKLTADDDECRLTLVGATDGTGPTLQAAAASLLGHLEDMALAFRHGNGEHDPDSLDAELVRFLTEIAELSETGGDIRTRVFAPYETDDAEEVEETEEQSD